MVQTFHIHSSCQIVCSAPVTLRSAGHHSSELLHGSYFSFMFHPNNSIHPGHKTQNAKRKRETNNRQPTTDNRQPTTVTFYVSPLTAGPGLPGFASRIGRAARHKEVGSPGGARSVLARSTVRCRSCRPPASRRIPR